MVFFLSNSPLPSFVFSSVLSLSLFFFRLQMFSDYQMQQMSEHFIDSFGFGTEDIGDSDEAGR